MSLLSLFGGTHYQYRVGDIVHLPGEHRFREIQWRGYVLMGPPGRRKRYPVYWLGEGTWDCYFEDELRTLSALPF